MRYQRFWKGLQQLGLNAYEARSYLVLLGHSRFKALELAPRARVPRQKIYEVLDSLVEKGFARVVQDRTKLFSAVEPNLAIPAYLARKRQLLEHELTDQARSASNLMEDLSGLYSEGKGGRGTLDFLRIVAEPTQTAAEYRRMLAEVKAEYLEFSRPPYAVDPLDEMLVKQARVTWRIVPPADRNRNARQQSPAAADRVCGGGSGDPPGAVAAAETGAVRRQERLDRAARSGDQQADLDIARVRSCRLGRGDEAPV